MILTLASCTPSQPIRIGIVGATVVGSDMANGARLAADQINRNGGINGRALELVLRADSGSGATALRIARELTGNQDIVAVVGHETTRETMVAAPIYNDGSPPLPILITTAGGTRLSVAGTSIFRIAPADRAQAEVLATWVREDANAESASLLFENTPSGRTVEERFVGLFSGLGGIVLASDMVIREITGLRPLVRSALAVSPDAVVIVGSSLLASELAREVRAQSPRMRILVGGAVANTAATAGLPSGVFVAVPELSGTSSETFTSDYRARFGGITPGFQAAAAYDAILLIAQAIETGRPDRSTIRARLAAVGRESPAFHGVTGRLAFDETGAVPVRTFAVGRVTGENVVFENQP